MALPKGTMTVEILADGTVKIETGDMSGASHKSADEFMEDFTRLLGGKATDAKAEHGHFHTHSHGTSGTHHHQ